MRLLILGGAGFIGSNFAALSIKAGISSQITVLDSLTYAGSLSNLHKIIDQIDFVHGDILDPVMVEKLVAEADCVINFAAETHNDNSLIDPMPFLRTNVVGTYNVVQACLKYDVRYHHISTDEVFGDLPLTSDEEFTTESPFNPSSPYSATKAASDLIVRAWVRSFGLRATISNCGNNYGPNQHVEKLVPRTIVLASSGIKPIIYGKGLNVRDWIHVDDHSEGILKVIEKGRIGETYLFGADQRRSNLQVVRCILGELDLPLDFIEFVADRPGHDLRYAIDASKSKEELGWNPKYESFEDGLKTVIPYYVDLVKSGRIDVSMILNFGFSTGI